MRCALLYVLSAALGAGCAGRTPTPAPPSTLWVGSWGAAQQLTEPRNLPPAPGLTGSTLRQVIHLSVGGRALRFRFSNLFGASVLTIASAHVARSVGGDAIAPASDRALTFGGKSSVVIAAGETATSDPLTVELEPFVDLAVSIHITTTPAEVTGHPGSRTTSYLRAGDWVSAEHLDAAATTEHWYVLERAEVAAPAGTTTVVALGNSITDGRGSGTDKNDRWPDNLSRRLQRNPRTAHVGVVNAGIGGNAVVAGGLGPTAVARFDRDVIAQPGVRWVIVLEGVNDIGVAPPAAAAAVADRLIAAYQDMIARAHRANLRIYGATILPFGGSFYDDPARESARQTVNRWIRASGAYDAVIDFDTALRDPENPSRLLAAADGGDHLHPNEAGYRMMGDAIDLSLFVPR